MALTSFDSYIARAGAIGNDVQPFYGYYASATSTTLLAADVEVWQRAGFTRPVPSPLPSGVTSYRPVSISYLASSATLMWVTKQINLGTITFGNSTATFSAGSSMPTLTFGNTSQQTSGLMMAEVTTALSATPGSITVTYTNQAGNSASTVSTAITASAIRGTCAPWTLATGDYGVRAVTGITASGTGASQSGVITLWGLIPICMIQSISSGAFMTRSLLTSGIPPITLAAGDSIGLFQGLNTARAISGWIEYVGGS